MSYWVGNALGCVVTAAIGDQIVDAIEWIVTPINWSWIESKLNEVHYPIPSFEGTDLFPEHASVRSSSVAYEDPAPPRPNAPLLCEGEGPADWVSHLQELLSREGDYTASVDGIFGPKTFEAVRAYQSQHGLHVDGIVGDRTWAVLMS